MPAANAPRLYRAGDWPVLREAGPAETDRRVRELCDHLAFDLPGYGDDELVAVGIMLSTASHPTAAGAVLDWIEAAPSPGRFEIVCGLLRGLWFCAGTGQCTDERVTRLLAVRDPAGPGAGGRYRHALVLLRAAGCGARPEPLRPAFLADTEELRGALRDRLRSLLGTGERWLTRADRDALDRLHQGDRDAGPHGLGETAAAVFTEDVCEEFAREYPEHDLDRLSSVANALSHEHGPVAAETALEWLAAAPSPPRFEIACWLLSGSPGECTPSRAARLLDHHEHDPGVAPGPEQRYPLALVLEAAVRNGGDGRSREALHAVVAGLPEPEGHMMRARLATLPED
ncbi:hypothetical protein DPM19_18110 [Actinomadura craniellae]|uniref:Uncharacterized protein n=1 Tax=Actinomadura craniellae TaxID=2231787 RepID=A0A365H5T2_9ACTN|nr:hypothetical protein [Actinomadura craniellae]RAY13593.1 hypothetical protein DPM19_18110 [Actinomadura craniellae]